MYSLRKSLGTHANNLHSTDIGGSEYRSNKFIAGIVTDKPVGLSFTRMNTRGNFMTVHLKSQTNDDKADRMRIIPVADQIYNSETSAARFTIKHQL